MIRIATYLLAAALGSTGCAASTSNLEPTGAQAAMNDDDGSADARAPKAAARGAAARDAAAPAPATLPVSLATDAPSSAVDAPLALRVEVANPTDEPALLLLWNTPFEPVLSADAFAITRDGERVPYRGRMVKRLPPPGEDDTVRLPPNATLGVTLDLAEHYALDVPGTYEIAFAERRLPIDDGSKATARFARLVPTDGGSVVIERR